MNKDVDHDQQRIPEVVITRVSRYHSTLYMLEREGIDVISSRELGEIEGLSPAMVRKDLSTFGSFGRRGLGYNVTSLKNNITRILGLNRKRNIAIIGAGQFSNVLITSDIFQEKNLFIAKIFDNTKELINKKLRGIVISDIRNLEKELDPEEIDLAVIALPPNQVQSIVDRLSRIGVKGVLYFASRNLKIPDHMVVRKRDISVDLGALTYHINHKNCWQQ